MIVRRKRIQVEIQSRTLRMETFRDGVQAVAAEPGQPPPPTDDSLNAPSTSPSPTSLLKASPEGTPDAR